MRAPTAVALIEGAARPMTSVKGAGFSSGPGSAGSGSRAVFDPFQQGGVTLV